MSVAILLVTHGDVGRYLHEAAVSIIGSSPLRVRSLSVTTSCQPDELLQQAQGLVQTLDSGDGILILTDIYGSTPSNIACAMKHHHVEVVAGLNLPMLVRVLNYPNLPLDQLADKAVSGGREGVIFFQDTSHSDATSKH